MTLLLELGQVQDDYARRALEQLSMQQGIPGPAGATGPAGPAGPTGLPAVAYPFIAYGTGTISVTAGVPTKYGFANEVQDPNGVYAGTPDYCYIAPLTGFYRFAASIPIPAFTAAGNRIALDLFVNSAIVRRLKIDWSLSTWSNDQNMVGDSGLVYMTAGQKADVYVTGSQALTAGGTNGATCFFSGYKVG
jgi:hypothetical protein